MNPPSHPIPCSHPAGDLDSVADTLGGFRGKGTLTRALMSLAHISFGSRGKSAALFSIKSPKARKRVRVRESFYFFFFLCVCVFVYVGKSCNGRKERRRGRGGGGGINWPNRKVSVCALTVVDVGRAEALLKLFGGEF